MQKRTYTVSTVFGGIYPSIRLSGKWLEDKGFEIGSKLELIESNNMIILIKKPNHVVQKEKRQFEISKLEKQLKQLTLF